MNPNKRDQVVCYELQELVKKKIIILIFKTLEIYLNFPIKKLF